MDAKFVRVGTTLIVRMVGELDHHAAEKLRTKIDAKLKREGVRDLLFDFQGVQFMDSSGLGMVLGRYKLVSAKGGKVLACGLNQRIKRIFEMAGLQKRITICRSEEDALSGA
ncbi:MAG: anti-sigma F factor antagonist [Firmicutes bacterium]|nr:anti-sigma F factor antagonist [Bacillota bacterium]